MKDIEAMDMEANAEDQLENEIMEALRILDQAFVPHKQAEMIKRVFDEMSRNGRFPYFGSMSIYELGRIHGIRAERKRRKRGSAA